MSEITSSAAAHKPAPKQRNGFYMTKERFQHNVMKDKALPPCAKQVGWAISTFFNRKIYNEDGVLTSWPGVEKIASMMGLDRRSVLRGLRALCRHGHIQVVKGKGRSNTYVVPGRFRVIEGGATKRASKSAQIVTLTYERNL